MKLVPGATSSCGSHDASTPDSHRWSGRRQHRPLLRRLARLARPTRLVAAASVLVLPVALALPAASAQADAAVGQGFTVTPSDLAYILKQIKIAERHSRAIAGTEPTAAPNPNPATDPNYCAALLGPGRDQIPDKLAPYGLRTVDGSCNNLIPGRERFGAVDQTMPRRATAVLSDAETSPAAFGPPAATSYRQKKGSVFDSRPRTISNLISDQTSTNPAAVAAAGFPVRTQGNPGVFPCTTEPGPDGTGGVPAGCVPKYSTLFIPNVSTDVGLTPPYNSLFTFFGQFFDHGLDQTVKGGGTVFVPLQPDDPLVPGADHVLGTADDLPADQRFMVLTRAKNQPGPDGILGDRSPTIAPATPCTALNTPAGCDESADDVQEATNTDSPWVDQSQTYASHPSHQVFLREYVNNVLGRPVSTGGLLGSTGARATGLATWADVKAQAATLLGLRLTDADALSVPMVATDPYGQFIPGPRRGLPQYVTATGLVEGNTAAPVAVPADVKTFDTPFLTDITDNAVPRPGFTPDADSIVSPSLTPCAQPGIPAGCVNQYDDEMLDAHFAAGDGRANENIALSSIHQVFHSEHNRMVADIENTLVHDTTPSGVAALKEWRDVDGAAGWNGERIFQAARFVTEMEYQHLVFGEFARKLAPAIPAFRTYDVDINPAIRAEFAHAVYRLGHSMLDEQVARTLNGKDGSLPLLTAFLNPPGYYDGGPAEGELSPEAAAGSLLMGASGQVGNEIDEFMTDTLRNNLLGLPLDLATLNLTRAREAGVPPLNAFRRQLFAATNNSHLKPYESWTDFGQGIKHPESLVNFVAAYGRHPTILTDAGPDGVLVDDPGTPADESADNGMATLASRRLAARRIVDPAVGEQHVPADAADFMLGRNAWADDVSGATTTGVDDIDLWIGGLAEATEINGGMLGSTFDEVFQQQMTELQDGDRLYYLARTPGMNLGSQLEGNSFAEMILRNTVGTDSLDADAFGTADCTFQLKDLDGTPAGFDAFGSTVADDPLTATCDESKLLLRMPDGTIQYRQGNSVDPPGINKQAVYNGTAIPDRVWGGNGNDTFWGLAGNDVIEGGGGIDNVLGGEGNDIITDLAGADILKGGPGNDAVDGGRDNDIVLGGDGQDVLNGGANDDQAFGGPGNDFAIGGLGADAVQGDGGDDWIEGGPGQDLLTGDHGAPFFDDPGQVAPGNEVMIGQSGDDYVAEGGDDVMASNAAPIDTFTGSAGFDWVTHQFDTVAADDDLTVAPGVQLPPGVSSDRWQETEAVSGSAKDDVIRGDDVVPRTLGGAGSSGCDVLDQSGVDRISGLGALLPQPLTGDPRPVVAASVAGYCPVDGPVWGEGNILLGGPGSDTIRGGGGDDVIDGDKSLSVRISVRNSLGNEIGSTDLIEHTYQPLNPRTLQADVFAGTIDPGNLVAVREIVAPPAGDAATSVDTAVFSDTQNNYTVTTLPAGAALGAPGSTTTVRHDGGGPDGTDTLRNIEKLQFATTPVPQAPTGVSGVAGDASATVSWTAPANASSSAVTGYSVRVLDANDVEVGGLRAVDAATRTLLVTGLANGTAVRFQVAAVNSFGRGPFSALSAPVTPDVLPGAPAIGVPVARSGSVTVTWAPPTRNGGSQVTSYSVRAFDGAGNPVGAARPAGAGATSLAVLGLVNGSAYTFTVTASNGAGAGPASAPSDPVVPHVNGSGFIGRAPTRVMDTRTGTGVARGRLGAAGSVTLTIPGLPSDATAVVLNVTAIKPTSGGFLTVYPAGTARPTTSNLNFTTGQTIPNLVMVRVGAGGRVTFFNSAGTVDVAADLSGYYVPSSGAGLVGETPRRVMDTRVGTGVPKARIGGGTAVTLSIPNLPAGATSVVLNLTATNATTGGFLTVYPAGAARPTTSNLNFAAGRTISNLAVVKVGPGGKVTIYNSAGSVDVVADLSGSYNANRGDGFTGQPPRRVMDTRSGTGVARAKVAAGGEVTLTIPGLPAGTTSVALNVTAANPTAAGFLTVFPSGGARPATYSVSFARGQVIPNLVVVNVGPGGRVTFFNSAGTTDVVADLAGSYRP